MTGKYDHIINKYRHRFFDERFKSINVNFPEGPYLVKIYEKTTLKMNDLTNIVHFHKSHSTRAIRQLSENGYIEKTIDPNDQRGYILTITESGKVVAKQVLKVIEEWDNLVLSVVTDEEKKIIENIQNKIYEKLKSVFEDGEQEELIE